MYHHSCYNEPSSSYGTRSFGLLETVFGDPKFEELELICQNLTSDVSVSHIIYISIEFQQCKNYSSSKLMILLSR